MPKSRMKSIIFDRDVDSIRSCHCSSENFECAFLQGTRLLYASDISCEIASSDDMETETEGERKWRSDSFMLEVPKILHPPA